MNEEHMIRISKPKNVGGKVGVRISWIGYYPRPIPMLTGEPGIEIENIDKLELAPPKDWKPVCFQTNMGDSEILHAFHCEAGCPFLEECNKSFTIIKEDTP